MMLNYTHTHYFLPCTSTVMDADVSVFELEAEHVYTPSLLGYVALVMWRVDVIFPSEKE